ncbi:IS3 family transposase [Paenibacillus sp. LX16]|uniref:IS3 family transposase n=1 Tax=Paenibacillus sp. LX16 TaxID=1740264 RepID=UPI003FA69E5E
MSEIWRKHKIESRNYIRFYNRRRTQRKLNKLTLVGYRRQFCSLGVFSISTNRVFTLDIGDFRVFFELLFMLILTITLS